VKPEWRKESTYVLWHDNKPTGIELHAEFGSGWFFMVDVNTDPNISLADAMPLKQAKQAAVYRAKKLGRIP